MSFMMFTITLTSPLINLKMSIFCISIIHHFAFIVSSLSLTRCFSNKRSIHLSQKVPRRPHPKPTRTYNTRENKKRRMNVLEQENHDLREEVTSLQVEMEKLTNLVSLLAVTHSYPPPPPPLSLLAQTTMPSIPVSTVSISTPQHTMPWGIPFSFGEVLRPQVSKVPQYAVHVPPPGATVPQATMVHTIPQDNGRIFHSGSVGAYDRMD